MTKSEHIWCKFGQVEVCRDGVVITLTAWEQT